MKKLCTFLFAFMVSFTFLYPQENEAPPQAFGFQAIIINQNGRPVRNDNVYLRISIYSHNTHPHTLYYSAFHQVTTDNNGGAYIEIGRGGNYGNFESIPWGENEFFLQVAYAYNQFGPYSPVSETQLISVPYSLYAGGANHAYSTEFSEYAESAEYAYTAGTAEHVETAEHANTAGHAETAEYANIAETAEHVENVEHANTAGTAEHAQTAEYANIAGTTEHVETAEHANTAGHAETAGHANTAGTAEFAETAEHANTSATSEHANIAGHAETAEHANTAGTAEYADIADYAFTAGSTETEHATYSDTANYAFEADVCMACEHSSTSQTAVTADHANNASQADEAIHAQDATHADNADYADVAGSLATEKITQTLIIPAGIGTYEYMPEDSNITRSATTIVLCSARESGNVYYNLIFPVEAVVKEISFNINNPSGTLHWNYYSFDGSIKNIIATGSDSNTGEHWTDPVTLDNMILSGYAYLLEVYMAGANDYCYLYAIKITYEVQAPLGG